MKRVTADRLREVLDYHPETGIFRRKVGGAGRRFGDIAGGLNEKGHRRIRVDRQKYYAGPLAWLYVHGRWPRGIVDHRNGNPDDNRIANLREATPWQNAANIKRTARNREGFIGIARNGRGWLAQIRHRNEPIYLGTFATKEEAHRVYVEAATRYRAEYAAMYPDPLPPLAGVARPPPLTMIPKAVTKITAERLREILSYDPATGIFRWLIDGKYGPSASRVGTVAGSRNPRGDLTVGIDGGRYMLHHLAWLYVHGRYPVSDVIDHINCDPSDNRIANLREATKAQNSRNQRGQKQRRSPFKGTHQVGKRWQASIGYQRRRIYLGRFNTAEEAHAAYVLAARLLFGEFARG